MRYSHRFSGLLHVRPKELVRGSRTNKQLGKAYDKLQDVPSLRGLLRITEHTGDGRNNIAPVFDRGVTR